MTRSYSRAGLPLRSRILTASTAEPFLAAGFTLKAHIALAMLDRCHADPVAPTSLTPAPADTTLVEPLTRLLRLWDAPEDMAVLRPLIEAELAWRLASGRFGALLRQIFHADGAMPGISRVLELLHDQPGRALRVEELAAVAAMSVTTFHRHFRDLTGATPVQYRKQLRLEHARTRVLSERHDIAAISLSAGYASPSQFSRDYRRALWQTAERRCQLHRLLVAADGGGWRWPLACRACRTPPDQTFVNACTDLHTVPAMLRFKLCRALV